jgi:Cu(I)/Ag(I) efflux system membrane protein CusA/SilA
MNPSGISAQLPLPFTFRSPVLMQFPEVERVFGKVGRAETATDPAGLEMFETTVHFKPRSEWPSGKTKDELIEEMNAALQIPGLSNLWVQPIRNRIDMLSTGIKSPVGIKIAGPDLKVIEKLGEQVEATVKQVPGTRSAYAERVQGGRYIEIRIDRVRAARFGLSLADVQQVVALAIGGENVGETVEGLQRFPINMRYPRELRDSVEKLTLLPIVTAAGATTTWARSLTSSLPTGHLKFEARMPGSTAGSMSTSAVEILGAM